MVSRQKDYSIFTWIIALFSPLNCYTSREKNDVTMFDRGSVVVHIPSTARLNISLRLDSVIDASDCYFLPSRAYCRVRTLFIGFLHFL